jgi:hypothetical protein
MPLCDLLLRCAEEPALFRVLWNDKTIDEIGPILLKSGYTADQSARRLRGMRECFPEASVATPEDLVDGTPSVLQLQARQVLAAAIHEKAHVIVTARTSLFPKSEVEKYDILVHHPDEFFIHQFHLSPQRLQDVIDSQAEGVRVGRKEILTRLSRYIPGFVELFR